MAPARALLVALACAVCASEAARYGDYAGARMPQYGGGDYDAREPHAQHEPDDYRGHSPDAPAALDYKYEEDIVAHIGKTEPPALKEPDETDSWRQRPARKHKKSRAVDSVHTVPADSFDPDDDFPKPRSSNRFTKYHTRLKSRKFERQDEDSPKYLENHRSRSDDSDIEEELQIDKDFREVKSKSFDDDRYVHRVGTDRVVRRKPRDRQMRRNELDSAEMPKSDSERERWPLGVLGRAPAPGPLEERVGRRRNHPEELAGSQDFPMDDDDASPQDIKPRKQKNYDEYGNDYYDMKRVMNIKKQLPTLLRRSTATETPWTTATNVAERELTALLGARRQRKEARAQDPGPDSPDPAPDAPPPTTLLPPTFAPHALAPAMDHHWNAFIATNDATRHRLSACLIILALINYLEGYSWIFCYIKQLCLTKLLSVYSEYEKCFIS